MILRYKQQSSNSYQSFNSISNIVQIGRSPGPDTLCLSDDPRISRKHARIGSENNQFWVEDLNSKSGTRVNGNPVNTQTKQIITSEDQIAIGIYVIEIVPEPSNIQTEVDKNVSTLQFTDEGIFGGGTIATEKDVADVSDLLSQTSDPIEAVSDAQRYLMVVSELSIVLGTAQNTWQLINIALDYIAHTLQAADGTGIRLSDDTDLYQSNIGDNRPIFSETLKERVIDQRSVLIWRQSSQDAAPSLQTIQCAMYAPLIWQDEVYGVIYVNNLYRSDVFGQSELRLLSVIASQLSLGIKNQSFQDDLRREEVIRSNLMRQFSPQVAEQFMRHQDDLSLGGQLVEPVTVLVSDVRGFTSLSMNMQPSEVMDHLNTMFERLAPIIFAYGGTIDKYVGDAILAVFGSPQSDDNQWENAILAALQMQVELAEIDSVFEIGIGIHSGALMHGFIGSPERMEFTVIGDTVNRASRFCDAAQKGEVVISEAVYEQVKTKVVVSRTHQVKTKHPEREPDMLVYVVDSIDNGS